MSCLTEVEKDGGKVGVSELRLNEEFGKKATADVFSGGEEVCWMGWEILVQEKADLGTLLTVEDD